MESVGIVLEVVGWGVWVGYTLVIQRTTELPTQ